MTIKIPTNTQVIHHLKASRKIVLNKLDRAFVDKTVYPPNNAHTPTSIVMYMLPYFCDRESRTSMIAKKALREV